MFARLTDAHDERMAALGLAGWEPCPRPGNPRACVSSQAAETDPALLDAAELHIADLVGLSIHDLPSLSSASDEQPAIGQRLGQERSTLSPREALRLDHELPGNRLIPILTSTALLSVSSARERRARERRTAPARGQPLISPPRQPGYELLGGVLGISWPVLSQKVALA